MTTAAAGLRAAAQHQRDQADPALPRARPPAAPSRAGPRATRRSSRRAETRSDASSASATAATPSCAALPTVTTECSGSPPSAIVTLIAIDDDWDTTATPALARRPAPTPPCWSGQISTRVGVVDQPVAVRPEQRHRPRGGDAGRAAAPRRRAGLGEARAVHDRPAAAQPRPARPPPARTRGAGTATNAASGTPGSSATPEYARSPATVAGVGCTGQIAPREAQRPVLLDHPPALPGAPDDRDRARPQQPPEVARPRRAAAAAPPPAGRSGDTPPTG